MLPLFTRSVPQSSESGALPVPHFIAYGSSRVHTANMRSLPKGISAHRKKFRAALKRHGTLCAGPSRGAINEALRDLAALRAGLRPPASRRAPRALPKGVYKHHGLFRGYRAARRID